MSNFLFPESQQSWEDNNPINIFPVSSNVVNIALTGAKSELQKFFASPTALEKLDLVFDITDPSAAHILIENSAAGIFEQIPHLQIVHDAAMNGAQGAFSQATNTIYLSDSLVRGDSLKVQEVLLEEVGHKFDTLLNPGGDTSGDEGELFKDVVLGLPLSQPELLRIQTENDFGTVVIDNQAISVEQAQNSMADAIVSNDDGIYIRRSDGSQFLSTEKWTDIGYLGTKGTWFADVTGDGKADAIVSNDDGVYVRRSDGSQFLPTEKWTDIGYLGTKGSWFADVTGDGKADAIVSNDEGVYKGVYVRRSDGSQFLPTEKWTDIAYWGTKGTWFADVTLTGKYQLPYPDGKTYQVTQGNNNTTSSHSDTWNRYAWDFNMPEGSTVVATRGGKVISLYEGSNTTLNSINGWATYTNYVLIDHGDGTSALYAHLKYNSVLPNVGDNISQNQPIAQSGKTGYVLGNPGDHLHYSVQKTPSSVPPGGFKNTGGYWQESLPSSFSDPGVLSKNSNGVPTYPNNYTS